MYPLKAPLPTRYALPCTTLSKVGIIQTSGEFFTMCTIVQLQVDTLTVYVDISACEPSQAVRTFMSKCIDAKFDYWGSRCGEGGGAGGCMGGHVVMIGVP